MRVFEGARVQIPPVVLARNDWRQMAGYGGQSCWVANYLLACWGPVVKKPGARRPGLELELDCNRGGAACGKYPLVAGTTPRIDRAGQTRSTSPLPGGLTRPFELKAAQPQKGIP